MRVGAMVLLAAAASACGDDQAPEGASELLARIRQDSYRTWDRAPGYETRRRANSPHADHVDIYVNAVVHAALSDGPRTEWPVGSIIVKDGWNGSDLELIAVMEKRVDGWFWAEFFGDESKYSGKPSLCTDCHQSGGDFVRAFSLPR